MTDTGDIGRKHGLSKRRFADGDAFARWLTQTMTNQVHEHVVPAPAKSTREQALERLRKRRDLGAHAIVYIVVNAALWAIWAVTGAGYPWPAWSAAAGLSGSC